MTEMEEEKRILHGSRHATLPGEGESEPESEPEPEPSQEPERKEPDMDDLIQVPDIPMPSVQADLGIKDEVDVAFKYAFIGAGQAGGRMVESFWKAGYRRVCAVNTNNQDLVSVDIPEANKMVMDVGTGGAGKDPEKGSAAAQEYYEDIYDFMKRCFEKDFDRIFLCVGAGGGTGGGSCETILKIAHDIAQSFRIEVEGGPTSIGVIASMPRVSEGSRVNGNALGLLNSLFDMASADNRPRYISPLIICDNEKIGQIHQGLSVGDFWDTANRSICSLFHLFNSIAIRDSEFTVFDKADFKDILDSGVVSFGACQIDSWTSPTDISYAVRDNLKRNVLVSDFDLSQATTAGCIFIGHSDVMNSIPQENLEHGYEMLSRIMGSGSVVHRGIYKGSSPGLVVYSILGGLGSPGIRMDEIAKTAG